MVEMKPSKEQTAVITSNEPYVTVISSAASGKTATLIERIRYLIHNGVDPSRIVAITFTNNAADEIRTRLGKDYNDEMFIGTIHSYANMLLIKQGISTTGSLRSNQFDELFEIMQMHPEAIEEVDHLLLDEAQDSNHAQFTFITDTIEPKSFTLFGDPRQSIYGFNGGKPELLIRLSKQSDVASYDMTDNYRNGQQIIDYSNWILGKMKGAPTVDSKCMTGHPGSIEKIKNRDIPRIIKASDSRYGDWVILCRTNRKVESIIYQLEAADIPAITFKQAENTNDNLESKIKSNNVKVLTIHSSKGLEFPNVIVAEQRWRTEEDLRLMYVAATRAKEQLYWGK